MTKSILSTKKTKSEDELFNEFCQRAGYRPKPKDIYVIESDPRDDEKSVIIVDNYASLRKCRRNSGAAMSNNIRKANAFNSNSSLNNSKSYPKNMFDSDGGSSTDGRFLNNHIDNNTYFERNNSRDRSMYQSRTLPRDFLKRNVEFADRVAVERRVSASGVYRPPASRDDDYYKKSYDTLALRNSRNRDAYSGGDDSVSVHWPNAIPGSPSGFSARSQFRIRSGSLYRQPPSAGTHPQYYSQHQLHVDPLQQQSESSARSQSPSENEDFGTFDLDKIENERRKSHANLFQVDFNFDTGTAV